jgi:hypothetical protein
MTNEAAKALIETLANTLSIAIDNRNKLTALERTLEVNQPDLHEKYLANLKTVLRNPPTSMSIEGFARLQEKLIQG